MARGGSVAAVVVGDPLERFEVGDGARPVTSATRRFCRGCRDGADVVDAHPASTVALMIAKALRTTVRMWPSANLVGRP